VTHLAVPPATLQVAGDVAVPVSHADLTPDERTEMFALIQSHFEGVREDVFSRDLDEKDWVLRIVRDGTLVGFSTLQAYQATVGDQCVNVIYSGDTVMAPEAWGSPVLARGWIALVRAIQATDSDGRWFWLLLSSGFRTYRFLPVFWREFWPRYNAALPDDARVVMHELAQARFGASYDASAGVVRFEAPQRLRAHLAAVPEGRANDPHVRFFLERNPGHANGDELVCVTELSDANLTAAGVRMVRGSSR
jgi:hypothetical protein